MKLCPVARLTVGVIKVISPTTSSAVVRPDTGTTRSSTHSSGFGAASTSPSLP
jgi:hypothetical protein